MDEKTPDGAVNKTETPVVVKDNEVKNSSSQFSLSNVKIRTVMMGVAAFVVIVVLVFLFAIIRKGSTSQINKTSTEAQTAINQGKYEDAKKIYQQALNSNKNDKSALSGLITTISLEGNQKGQEKQALQEAQPYIDTLKSKTGDVHSLIAIGYAYEAAGDYQKAFDYYDRATKSDSKFADAWFHRGHVLMFLNKSAEGLDDYRKAVRSDPNNALAQMGLAGQLYSDKKVEESFQAYLKVSEIPGILQQNKAEALAAAATIRRTQSNYKYMEEAFGLSKKAVDADPTFAPALASYGYNLFLTGSPVEGEDYMKRAIAANPRISKNYSDLGIILRGVRRFDDSINYQKLALDRVKDDNTIVSSGDRTIREASYTYQLAKTYSMSGASVDVMPLLQHAIQLNPYIKTVLKSDESSLGLFKELSGNSSFQELIK